MKTACVYHSQDLDGWMSAAIVKHWWESKRNNTHDDPIKSCYVYKEGGCSHVDGMLCNTKTCDILHGKLTFIGYNYGQPTPDLSEYDEVIMVDVSFPKEEMLELRDRLTDSFIWNDHHISAISDNRNEEFAGMQGINFAACELTWKYFFPDEPMPEIVRLLGRYDCFGHIGTDEEKKVFEFQYGARSYIQNYEQAYKFLIGDIKHHGQLSTSIYYDGVVIYKHLCEEAKQIYKNGFEILFTCPSAFITQSSSMNTNSAPSKLYFICSNVSNFNPSSFNLPFEQDGYNGYATFSFDASLNKWKFSLRSSTVDCSAIAKQYGGGGHKGSAGFHLSHDQFTNLIINR